MIPPISVIAVTVVGGAAYRLDLAANLRGRFGGLRRECLHLARDNRKTPARLSCAGGLDRSVQREQIGLPGNIADQAHHVADARGGRLPDPMVPWLASARWTA